MSAVQRWDHYYCSECMMDHRFAEPDGKYVLFSDHERVVDAERAKNMPWTCGKDGTLNPYGFACIECIRLTAYEQGKADAERVVAELNEAHEKALAEAEERGEERGASVRIELVKGFGDLRAERAVSDYIAAAAPRPLTADDPEPGVGSVVLDKFGTAWQRFAEGWCCADGRKGQTWAWVCAVGPVTLIHDSGKPPLAEPDHEAVDAAARALMGEMFGPRPAADDSGKEDE